MVSSEIIGDDRPLSGCSLSSDGSFLATCSLSGVVTASADRTAKLWNTQGTLLTTYKCHLDRLSRVAFHPSGNYLGTTSFDNTWRLWDTETGELLYQEGHSRSVCGLALRPDGSLAASCGLDALARVWEQEAKIILAQFGI
ncbi:hypothetical protein CTI12_AA014240 [Artemisia annua]|uniref:Uncharacterized protein n=1 Tax=Artemisia annua TaxID=35608 RepID=A0A2U1QLQ6_ARTAN|nr:hypothetical protein CTI12_AA014240 [Artemisia annua]